MARIQNAGANLPEELESSEDDEEDEVTNEDEGTTLCELEENEQFVDWKKMAVELLCFNKVRTTVLTAGYVAIVSNYRRLSAQLLFLLLS